MTTAKRKQKRPPVRCPYCNRVASLVYGDAIYPARCDLHDRLYWSCAPCKAYVGCHKGTTAPLGRLADADLRLWKQRAHAAFDPLWKSGAMRRKDAYVWLADQLNTQPKRCHIGEFDVAQCIDVVTAVENYLAAKQTEQECA